MTERTPLRITFEFSSIPEEHARALLKALSEDRNLEILFSRERSEPFSLSREVQVINDYAHITASAGDCVTSKVCRGTYISRKERAE